MIYFINNALGVSTGHWDLVACHELGVVSNPRRPPPIIAKFKNFDLKNRIWGRKKLLRNFRNPHNHESVYMDERLTKVDKELLMYASDLGFRVSTNNSKPLVINKTGENIIDFHTIVSKKDIDELSAKCILLQKSRSDQPSGKSGTESTISNKTVGTTSNVNDVQCLSFSNNQVTAFRRSKRGLPKPSPVTDSSLINHPKGMINDDQKILDFIKGLLSNSPHRKIPCESSNLTADQIEAKHTFR